MPHKLQLSGLERPDVEDNKDMQKGNRKYLNYGEVAVQVKGDNSASPEVQQHHKGRQMTWSAREGGSGGRKVCSIGARRRMVEEGHQGIVEEEQARDRGEDGKQVGKER